MGVLALVLLAGLSSDSAVKLEQPSVDECRCHNFKDVYDSGFVTCGQGWEGDLCKASGWPVPDDNWCLKRNLKVPLNTSYLNADAPMDGEPDDMLEWCYVLSTCQNLRGGTVLNRRYAWKGCSLHDERIAPYLNVNGVVQHYESLDKQAFHLLLGLTYPVETSFTWRDVDKYYSSNDTERLSVKTEFRTALQSIIDADTRLFICDAGLNPEADECKAPFSAHIVQDMDVWEVSPSALGPLCKRGTCCTHKREEQGLCLRLDGDEVERERTRLRLLPLDGAPASTTANAPASAR